MVVWHPVGGVGSGDLPLGAGDPLGHGALGNEEGCRGLGHGEAAEQPEGECDPGLRGECRVAAGEDQPQAIIFDIVIFAFGRLLFDNRQHAE